MQAKGFLLPILLNNAIIYSKALSPVFFHKKSTTPFNFGNNALKMQVQILKGVCFVSRRRVRYEEKEDNDDETAEYGHNSEISALESYSESARNEVLLVRAAVDDQEEEILIFRGFSSCLSYRTSPDPSRSILPARAKITSIDRIRGPFDPSNIEYIEEGLSWDSFKNRFLPNYP